MCGTKIKQIIIAIFLVVCLPSVVLSLFNFYSKQIVNNPNLQVSFVAEQLR